MDFRLFDEALALYEKQYVSRSTSPQTSPQSSGCVYCGGFELEEFDCVLTCLECGCENSRCFGGDNHSYDDSSRVSFVKYNYTVEGRLTSILDNFNGIEFKEIKEGDYFRIIKSDFKTPNELRRVLKNLKLSKYGASLNVFLRQKGLLKNILTSEQTEEVKTYFKQFYDLYCRDSVFKTRKNFVNLNLVVFYILTIKMGFEISVENMSCLRQLKTDDEVARRVEMIVMDI